MGEGSAPRALNRALACCRETAETLAGARLCAGPPWKCRFVPARKYAWEEHDERGGGSVVASDPIFVILIGRSLQITDRM